MRVQIYPKIINRRLRGYAVTPLKLQYQTGLIYNIFCLIHSCLTMDSAKTLVHAFISSGLLDYCNSPLVGAADCVIRKLQRVQNAAARLITGTRKFDHIYLFITPILRDLQPVVELAGRRHLSWGRLPPAILSVRRSQELCCFRSRHSEQSTNRPASFVTEWYACSTSEFFKGFTLLSPILTPKLPGVGCSNPGISRLANGPGFRD